MAPDRRHAQPAQAVAVQAIPAAGAGGSDSLRETSPCLARAARCESERLRDPSPLMAIKAVVMPWLGYEQQTPRLEITKSEHLSL